jgi:hypothetical protein
MAETTNLETIERRSDIYKDARSVVDYWRNAIKLSEKTEQKWRDDADKAVKLYRADNPTAFNILHSNIATIVPSIYNSTPVADIRSRHSDKGEVARKGAQILERGISFQLDEYDFDAVMAASVRDMQLAGRGVDRVRYRPYMRRDVESGGPEEAEAPEMELGEVPEMGTDVDAPNQPEGEEVVWEEAVCEHVTWRSFRRGPGAMWTDVNWVAFELFLTRDEVIELAGEEVGMQVSLTSGEAGMDELNTEREKTAFKKARVWEIWDKTAREVLFICADGYDAKPLRVEPDPLGLLDFFPNPAPLQAISDPDTMVPVVPYEIYRRQAEELSDVSKRILALIGVMRFRGFRAPEIPDFEQLENLEDGEFAVASQALSLIGGGKALDDAIWVVPVEKLVLVLRELVGQRESIKAAIFEITGIADIMRGASNPNETLGAQQIKTQWGSLRVQQQQRDVARYCRDLFRMTAEIIANKFSIDTLTMIAGEPFETMMPDPMAQMPDPMAQMQMGQGQPQMPPQGGMPGQPPQAQQAPQQPPPMIVDPSKSGENHPVIQMLRNDIRRTYLIDIETDSTVRGDLVRSQQNMSQFLQGTAQFFGSLVPLIQSGTFPPELAGAAITVYEAFGRQFKLGKQVEDKFAELSKAAEETMKAPQEKPDPKAAEKQAAQQAEQAKAQAAQQEAQQKGQIEAAKIQADTKKATDELQFKAMALQADREDRAAQREIENRKIEIDEQDREERRAIERVRLRLDTAAQNKQLFDDASEPGDGSDGDAESPQTPAQAMMASITMLANAIAEGNQSLAQQIAAGQERQGNEFNRLAEVMAAPKRVVRDASGRASGVEIATSDRLQ